MVVIPWEEYQRLNKGEVATEREETLSGEGPPQEEEEPKLTVPAAPPPGTPAAKWLKWK
jgi:hypothetical protein